ncbi:acyltransferase family protein [Comamonas terrigena]|uniref:acyltransferase family protein n=1 Tax=Comamonas terrigena TaxID=32013 RepID=UPI002446F673|nr:acyltransferase [Comamonas terrigena]MDH1700756.1 acyltransferase [Comamonas terrigena]
MPKQSEVLSLTGLRFVSAFYVFLFHIHIRWPLTKIPLLKGIIDVGAVGMSVFFVLSGFLLFLGYHDIKGRVGDYLVNRVARIYPIYFLAGFLTLPWLNIPLGGGLVEMLVGLAKMAFIFIANAFVIQAWFPPLFNHWNNSGSWSISVEVFCYLLLPLMIPYLVKLSRKSLVWVLLFCYLFVVMVGLVGRLYPGYGVPVFYAMPIFRLPEFIIGGCVCLLIKDRERTRAWWGVQGAVIVLVALYLGRYAELLPIYVGHNWIVVPAVAFIIASLYQGGGPLHWLLSRRWCVWLGKISYCFYSFQALLIFVLIDHHAALIGAYPVFADSRILALASFVVLICFSALGYYLVEEPARKWIRQRKVGSTELEGSNLIDRGSHWSTNQKASTPSRVFSS